MKRSFVAWSLLGLWVLFLGSALLLDASQPSADPVTDLLLVLAGFAAFALVATLLIARTANPIGWLFMGLALSTALANLLQELGESGFRSNPGSGGAALLYVLGNALWFPSFAFVILSFLLFPSGHLASRRWRPAALLAIAGATGVVVANLIRPGPSGDLRDGPPNPIGIPGAGGVSSFLESGGAALLGISAIAAFVSVVIRYRRAHGEQRRQHQWVGFAAALIAGFFLIQMLIDDLTPDWLDNLGFGLMLLSLPTAMAIAILRYRLYDIDLVINKTLVYCALAAFITALYVGVVVGIGSLIGRGQDPNLGLSLVATGLVAVLFQPAR